MRGAISWMARNSVAANLFMLVILVGGFLGMMRVKQEVFPAFELDLIRVTTPYPGASPEEVEQGINLAVEEAVRGVDGVKRITSSASEGRGTVAVELLLQSDPDRVLADVKSAVGRIRTFPRDAEDPEIRIASMKQRVVSLVLAGDLPLQSLQQLAEKARDELVQDPGVTVVEVGGIPPNEIAIEISRTRLEEYGLTLQDVAQQIRASSLELPSGGIKTSAGEVLVRVADRRRSGAELGALVLRSTVAGGSVTLGEIATITDGFADTDQYSLFNGKPSVRVTAYRVGDETPSAVAQVVRDYGVRLDGELPDTVTVAIWDDRSDFLRGRIDLMLRNAALGGALVLIILALFLNVRLAFWVALGIPISFMGAFLLMPIQDQSVNMVSLFALIIVLGMVVDDAIIVGEAGYLRMAEGKSRLQAAVEGAHEVMVPVSFAILTTIAAFGPLLVIPGLFGKFFRIIPLVVISVLIFSLLESFFILPAHLAHIGRSGGWSRPFDVVQEKVSGALMRFVEERYQPFVATLIRWRYVVVSASIGVLLFGFGLVGSGTVPFSFFPILEGDVVTATIKYPYGTDVGRAEVAGSRLAESVTEVIESFGGESTVRGRFLKIGEGRSRRGPNSGSGERGSHIVTLELNLVPAEERDFTAEDFKNRWQTLAGEFIGSESAVFSSAVGPSAGAAVAIQLSHRDNSVLSRASADLQARLSSFKDLTNIENEFASGKRQLDFRLKEEVARPLGLTSQMVAIQLRSAFYGAEALREQRGRNEIRVMVRLPEQQRRSEHDLTALLIRTPSGSFVPLAEVAEFERSQAPTTIDREDGRRVVVVKGSLAQGVRSPTQVLRRLQDEVMPALEQSFPGLKTGMVGEQREQREMFRSLGPNFLLAMFVIFSLLAIPLKSYAQPLVIMSAIPFGFVGAVLGHLLMGYELSFVSAMGVIALSGVVVNDSLVLVDTTNRYRREGMSAFDAVVRGGVRRFRPILLTSLTTFFGLLPMIFETSVQARFLIPMAVSLGFGVLFATFVVLLLVPAIYMVVEDLVGLYASSD